MHLNSALNVFERLHKIIDDAVISSVIFGRVSFMDHEAPSLGKGQVQGEDVAVSHFADELTEYRVAARWQDVLEDDVTMRVAEGGFGQGKVVDALSYGDVIGSTVT